MSRKTPPIRDEERALWMALAMADMAIYREKGENCLAAHEASNEIRRRLVDQFRLNLDRFQEPASEIFEKIFQERKDKLEKERLQMQQLQELLDEANGTNPFRT